MKRIYPSDVTMRTTICLKRTSLEAQPWVGFCSMPTSLKMLYSVSKNRSIDLSCLKNLIGQFDCHLVAILIAFRIEKAGPNFYVQPMSCLISFKG